MVYAWACHFFLVLNESIRWIYINNMKEKVILFLTCADVSEKTETIILV